jgi:hypothetical protein
MAVFEPARSRRSIAGQVVWFTSWLAVTVVGAFLSPSPHGHGTHEQLGLPACPSVVFFDRPCPGCGLTTSFTATIHGRAIEAFQAHPLGPILYLIFTLSAVAALRGFMRRERFNVGEGPLYKAMWAFVIVFLSFGALRWYLMTDYAAPGEVPTFVMKALRDR